MSTPCFLLPQDLSRARVRLLDMYTTNLGNVFSELSVWILLCTAIAVFSPNPRLAAAKVFLFCAGMLATYYLTAELTGGVYSMSFRMWLGR